MRLLHVLAETGYSGGESQLEHLIRHLHARGHQNHLLLAPGAAFARVAEDLGLPTDHADLRRPWRPRAWRGVRRAVRGVRPDVLHFGCGRSLLWGGLFSLGLPARLRITTRRIDYPIGRGLRGARYRRLVDHVVANCESVRQRAIEAGVPAERVTLVHEGIEVAPWREVRAGCALARARLGIPPEALVVSCAATLRPRKGQRVLIDAFARIADRFPAALLVLAGEGPDLEALRRRAVEIGLEGRVRVPGPVRPVADLYAATDLFVMPSYNEGLSNACLEASAAGLPLVVSSVGGLPEIVEDGVTGAVVPPGDVAALGDSMGHYLDDEVLRARAGEAGSARTCQRFTAARMAEGMEALFARLVESADD